MASDLSDTRRKDGAASAMKLSMAGGIHNNNDNDNRDDGGVSDENGLSSGASGGGRGERSSSSVSNAIRAAAANSSAQTRFSFYDAQEVHLQFASSGNPTLTSQELQLQQQQQQQQSGSLSAKNNKNSAGKTEAQRFTFYNNDTNDDDDEEDGDQFYTPTAGRAGVIGLGTLSNPIKTHTPPHSKVNTTASTDAPRGGSVGAGVGVRTTTTTTSSSSSRTSNKKRMSNNHSAAREELAAVDNVPGLGAVDSSGSTDEILRSLQETEEQRIQLLKAVTPSEDMVRKMNPNGSKVVTNHNHNNTSSSSSSSNTKSSSIRRPMSVAATTLVQGGSTTTTTTAGTKASIPSLDAAGGTFNDATAANDSNPYEDAIKEALDLLRRHRSPSGGTPRDATSAAQNLPDTVTSTGTGALQLSSPRSRALRPRTPRENDRVLQSRLDDDDQSVEEDNDNVDGTIPTMIMGVGATSDPVASYEEAKLKAKQRQERMAGYASRLQEFKSSMPTEISDTTTTTTTTTAWQPRLPATNSINSPEGVHQPATAASTTNYTGSASMRQIQPQPQLGISHIPQHGSMEEGISDVSQSTRLRDDEIQRGVERVLLAILERANNSRSRGSQGSSDSPNEQQQDSSDATIKAQLSEEALIHAMEELLGQVASSDSLGGVKSEPSVSRGGAGPVTEHVSGNNTKLSTAHSSRGGRIQNEGGPPVVTTTTSTRAARGGITTKRSAEKSVVDELLAEEEEDDPEYSILQQCVSPSSTTVLAAPSMFSRTNWPGHREEKKLPDSNEAHQRRPNATSASKEDGQSGEEFTQIMDDCLESSKQEDDAVVADDDDETARQGDSVDCIDDDEHDETYTDAGDDEDGLIGSPSDKEGSLERVLGPLSKRGTTGVVLDLHNSPEVGQEEEEPPLVGESFSKVMKEAQSVMSYVSSAMSPNLKANKQLEQQEQKGSTVDEKYSAEDEDRLEGDEEAKELMRTLCAHLLPFGVDQSNQLVEIIPAWDETNPNEAGYRIIRLSKAQLRRVEGAFESMINSLKRDSERQLNKLELATVNGYDATFVKELQEAEKLLDDEERRVSQVAAEQQQKQQQRFAGLLGLKKKPAEVKPLQPGALSLNDDDKESVTGEPTPCHPDFPGLKTAGQGEMGDLEYFHLPIIFKSHVTGFEPTKDLVLEPGNVVAGQYLVESELGTAAFSTAYRCIDLSSENDNDGHNEVCLKVIKNTKDFFDQSLDEIKILELLRQTGKCQENHIVEMKTFFYHREHLVIVTELLRQNLFEFGKFILDNDEEPYFTLSRLAYISRQILLSLKFVHNLGLVHSDVKPENILLGSYSRAQVKLIDFGSSCYLTDRQSSYIQSRSYRAPEVVLGLPYDGRIDVWSLGCVVAEMYTGEVTFQNDSIVSMLSRIEAICGPFPRHMIAQGRQSGRFFTKSGLLYETVDDSESGNKKGSFGGGPLNDDSDSDSGKISQFDIFQPKTTCLASRLGFESSLMDDFSENWKTRSKATMSGKREQALFTDFVRSMLTIDPDGRPTAAKALEHPWMVYAATLTEEDIKYPSS